MKRFMLIGVLLLVCSLSVLSQYSITETKLLFTATNPTAAGDDTTAYFDVGKYITWGILAVCDANGTSNDTIITGLDFMAKNSLTGKTYALANAAANQIAFSDTVNTKTTAAADWEFIPVKSTTVDRIPGYDMIRIGREYQECGTVAGRWLKLYLVGTRIAKYPSGN